MVQWLDRTADEELWGTDEELMMDELRIRRLRSGDSIAIHVRQ